MENNKNLVVCQIAYDEIEEKWHFTATLKNFYNETIENITADSFEKATDEMNFWRENYEIEHPEALFQYEME